VLAVQLLFERLAVPKARRWGGLLTLAVLAQAAAGAKLLLEQGWSKPVVWRLGNGMSVVQAAHLAGSAWGWCWAWSPSGWAVVGD
jgi:hypothetical protein